MTKQELQARIAAQQQDSGLLPLEQFCVSCGTGHLDMPGGGSCRKCGHGKFAFRRHPKRR